MAKHSQVLSRRKLLNPVFHVQTKDEENSHLTNELIKIVRRTGQLNLSGRHLPIVPLKVFTMYERTENNADGFDLSKSTNEDEAWWNFKPLNYLDLSSNVLQSIPSQIGMFQDLTTLNLQDNCLTSVPKEIGNLTKLTKLNLNRNKINKLPKEFYKLTELNILSANHNCFEKIDNEFTDLVMLEKLDLSNNNISEIPPGIGFLVRLNELNLSYNKLSELPPDIVNIRALLKLDVTYNNLKLLPKMGELRKLQFLYAQHNDIEELPDFEGCESLQQIYLGNNFLKEVSVDFCQSLPHLSILELRDNQIESIPNEVAALTRLIRLDLTNNELTKLPNSLSLLPHLQLLKVEGNKLKHIRTDIINAGTLRILKHLHELIKDEETQNLNEESSKLFPSQQIYPDRYTMRQSHALNLTMKNIVDIPDECFEEAKIAEVTTVDLCKNKITKVPTGLHIIAANITELNLSMNQLKELPDFLGECQQLKFLDVSKNFLTSLPKSLENICLRELVISYNRFLNIPECVYQMIRLEIFLMNDNSITDLDISSLQNLKQLATLDLSNNNISHIPPELGNMTQLRHLELKGNTFRQPRYAILEQGTESILSYLRDRIPV